MVTNLKMRKIASMFGCRMILHSLTWSGLLLQPQAADFRHSGAMQMTCGGPGGVI